MVNSESRFLLFDIVPTTSCKNCSFAVDGACFVSTNFCKNTATNDTRIPTWEFPVANWTILGPIAG